jgi:short subunit dehydrogenase-like uncharacterized protein
MAGRARVLILGASGVFGRLLTRELLDRTSADLLLAGRSLGRLRGICGNLAAPERVEPIRLDLRDRGAVSEAAASCAVVACAAGPFQALNRVLPGVVVLAGAHWTDVADDPDWVLPILDDSMLDRRARQRGRVVLTGQSCVPALSGALARAALERLPTARAAVATLYIGNRNAKGGGAIASALGSGFGTPTTVSLPIGRRQAYLFASPDAELLSRELGIEAEFRVVFQLSLANTLVAILAPLAAGLTSARRAILARTLSGLAAPLARFGSDVGYLQVEVHDTRGNRATAGLASRGQRLAIVPCAMAIEALLGGDVTERGVLSPSTWLAPAEWLRRLEARGMVWRVFVGSRLYRRR